MLATVPAASASEYEAHYSKVSDNYLRLYDKYADNYGVQDAGRNIVLFGYRKADGSVKVAPEEEVRTDNQTFRAALAPQPEPVVYEETTYESTEPVETATTATTSSTSSGTVACESGGDYSANTGNGYYGGYQFDSGTWDAYGDSQYAEASDAPPAVQDAAAASVPYDAWPNC